MYRFSKEIYFDRLVLLSKKSLLMLKGSYGSMREWIGYGAYGLFFGHLVKFIDIIFCSWSWPDKRTIKILSSLNLYMTPYL